MRPHSNTRNALFAQIGKIGIALFGVINRRRSMAIGIIVGLMLLAVMADAVIGQEKDTKVGLDPQQGGYLGSAYERFCNLLECKVDEGQTEKSTFFLRDPFDYTSEDGKFRVKFGARLMVDAGGIDKDKDLRAAFGDSIDVHNIEGRRARLYASGGIRDRLDFRFGVDFSSQTADVADAWIGIPKIPFIGNINFGNMKEPLSIEEITSSSFITFMERSLSDYFTAGRRVGLMAHNAELRERLTWALGLFKGKNNFGHFGELDLVSRVTVLPWYEENGRKLFHLGLGYSHRFRSPDQTPIRIGTRPETHLTHDFLVDTGLIKSHGADLFNPEFALVVGPVSLQAEYYYMRVAAQSRADANLLGWYAYASYFLTGEHRSYYRPSGIFDLTIPKDPLTLSRRGWGAWEIGFRVSEIELNDRNADVRGGIETNYTFGLNWYWNANMRLMFNYTHVRAEGRPSLPDGNADIFQSRFQVEF